MTAVLIALLLNSPLEYVEAVYVAAQRANVDPLLACAVVEWESGFMPWSNPNPNKDGSDDYGLFGLNSRHHHQYRESIDKHIALGCAVLMGCLLLEGGDVERALSRYNTGRPDSETGARYAAQVLKIYERLKGAVK